MFCLVDFIASLAQTPAPMIKSYVLEYGYQKEGAKSYGDNHDESKIESTDQIWKSPSYCSWPITRDKES